MRVLILKWRPKEMIKPEHFCSRFDEKWKVVEKCDRGQKGYELRLVNGENLRKGLCIWIPLGHLSVLWGKDAPFLQVQGGHSHVNDSKPASEHSGEVRESLLYQLFLRFFQLKIIILSKGCVLGWHILIPFTFWFCFLLAEGFFPKGNL